MIARAGVARRPRAGGFSLPEVLVALALGTLLLLALARMVDTATRALSLRDTQSELRERARYALVQLEPEIQMAGFYGLTARGDDFRWLSGGDAAAAAGLPASALHQTSAPLPGTPTAAQACGDNYALDLSVPLQADNGRFILGPHRGAGCAASGGARAGSDTLTLRRAATPLAATDAGRLQLLVDRSDERRRWLLADGIAPAGAIAAANRLEWHDFEMTIFYVANDSIGAPGTPSLRMKQLTRVAGRPALVDNEVIPGIEDLQVRLVTDTGIFDPGGVPLTARVRLVEVWLRVRAANPEPGYRDTTLYKYADVATTPAAAEAGYRRLLVHRRIAVRNALP